MDSKHLKTLEYPKILKRLATYTSFSGGRELALNLEVTTDIISARERQKETTEARRLFALQADLSLGGVYDVRQAVKDARLGIVLPPTTFLDIRNTLLGGRRVRRTIIRLREKCPLLAAKAQYIEECPHLMAEIARCLDERGEVADRASVALARIRRQLKEAHEDLLDRLNRIIASPASATFLQEPLITQRGDRYVIPLKVEFKGRIPGLVHDQSSSGATLFIEPLLTVELNNRWRELQLEEEREVRRILAELSTLVAEEGDFIERTVGMLAELDLIFARAKYAEEIRGVEPKLVGFKKMPEQANRRHPGSSLRLLKARHPLLKPGAVVPIDVHLGDEFFILLITGPNTGGKTVSLKTVGLLTLMAQAGLHIPADEGSTLSVFNGIYADIGDEQSIEQSLSTFSSHLTNIVAILNRADDHSLVLLDELGAGTDPTEGSALARALLSTLLEKGLTTLATTHSSELKVYAHATPGVENASVEFDQETLSPTYELSIGLPGRSNAFAIAARLGLPGEIIDRARSLVSPQNLETEALLTEIKQTRQEMSKDRQAAAIALQEAESRERELGERLAAIEKARREVLAEARDQAQRELEAVRQEIRSLSSGLEMRNITEEWLAQAEERLSRLEQSTAPLERVVRQRPQVALAPGDTVWVEGLGATGQITALADDEVEVQVGNFRVRTGRKTLELRQKAAPQELRGQRAVTVTTARPPSPGLELDLRGLRVEEALPRLDKYLDEAHLAGLPHVRIIHGKGTGALRQATRQQLEGHPLVVSYRPGDRYEGGDGVTVAELVG